jgi:PAS domain S-box-containing protein
MVKDIADDNLDRIRRKAEKLIKAESVHINSTEKDKLIHELRVHKIELEMQNEELMESQIALEESRREYFELYDLAPVGYLTIDEKGIIKRSNLTVANMLGIERDNLINSAFIRFVAPNYKSTYYEHIQKILKTQVKQQCEIELLSKKEIPLFTSLNTVSVHDEEGNLEKFRIILTDVTERKNIEEDLNDSEIKFREIFDFANDMITLNGIKENGTPGKFIEVNETVIDSLGYSKDELLKMSPLDLIDPNESPEMSINAAELKNKNSTQFEVVYLTKDGKKVLVEVNYHLFEQKGKTVALAISRDITERKKAGKKLANSLKEKEILLKEIHHRVKNNLMIISSLLNLQSRYIKDKTSLEVFKESQNRARSMALIHDRLYHSTDLKSIDFGYYIQTLSNELFHTYNTDPSMIKVEINAENILLDINMSIPLGLIVNELITNSLKHAFPDKKTGKINIDFHFVDENYEFTVRDNGIGFPEDINFHNTDSLGLQLVVSLTEQIDGDITLKRDNGTNFKITFKDLEFKKG